MTSWALKKICLLKCGYNEGAVVRRVEILISLQKHARSFFLRSLKYDSLRFNGRDSSR